MGQRSRSESVVKIFQAFIAEKTWRQPDLARHVGVSVHRLRQILDELTIEGMPLERDEDSPTEVHWSVPKNWFPGGAFLSGEDLQILLRLLATMSKGIYRKRLTDAIAKSLSGQKELRARLDDVVVPPSGEDEERFLSELMDAAASRVTLRCRYYSRSSGAEQRRHLSVQKVLPGPPSRFIAVCHATGELRWFRADGILEAAPDESEPFRKAKAEAVREMLESSIDGFSGSGPVRELAFIVRDPDARWVERNLTSGMKAQRTKNEIRVVARTAAVIRVARFVVSLGASATPETPELARAVAELARGALSNASQVGGGS
jgi:predicted DNA-binding transcriptional regulator YafY